MNTVIICLAVLLVVAFAFWMKYEIEHPLDADDEHNEAVKFREQQKN